MSHISAIETIAEQLRNMGSLKLDSRFARKSYTRCQSIFAVSSQSGNPFRKKNKRSRCLQPKFLTKKARMLCSNLKTWILVTMLHLTKAIVADRAAMAEEVSLAETEAMMVHQLLRNQDTMGHSVTIANLEVSSPHIHLLNAENTLKQ